MKLRLRSKSLKVNAFFNGFYQILVLLAPLLTTPYISRVLGPDVIGDYSYYYSIVGYFTLVATFGFNDYGTKLIAENRDDLSKRSNVFWGIMFSKGILSMLCLVVYAIVILSLFSSNTTAIYVFLGMSAYIVSILLDPTFYFQGNENFVSISIRNSLIRILTIVCIFVFVHSESDIVPYTLVLSIGNLLATLIMYFSFRKGDVQKPHWKELHLFGHFKAAFAFFIPGLAVTLFTSLNQTMLGAMSTSEESGYYSQAAKIVSLLSTLAGSLSTIMLSRMSYLFTTQNTDEIERKTVKTFEAFWAVAIPLTFGIVAIAPTLVPVFLGPGYEGAVMNIYVLCPIIILSPINTLLGSLYYRPQNKIWIQTGIILFASALNVGLSYFLISAFDSVGASLGRSVAEIVQLPLLLYFAKKGLRTNVVFRPFIKPFDNGLIMFILVKVVDLFAVRHLSSSFLILAIDILVGALVYGLLEIWTKESFVYGLFLSIKGKVFKKKH